MDEELRCQGAPKCCRVECLLDSIIRISCRLFNSSHPPSHFCWNVRLTSRPRLLTKYWFKLQLCGFPLLIVGDGQEAEMLSNVTQWKSAWNLHPLDWKSRLWNEAKEIRIREKTKRWRGKWKGIQSLKTKQRQVDEQRVCLNDLLYL